MKIRTSYHVERAAVKCGGVSEEEGVLSATGHHVHTLINAIYGKYIKQ